MTAAGIGQRGKPPNEHSEVSLLIVTVTKHGAPCVLFQHM